MSMIQFTCPSCNTQYKVPAKAAGKQATCKSCNASMTVPMSNESSGGDVAMPYGGDAVAPPMEAGSIFAPTSSRRGGPSPMLLVGIGGGVLVLILAVVLIVVLTGGKGDGNNNNNTNNTTTAGNTDTDNTSGRNRGRGRGGSSGTTDTNDDDDDDDDNATPASAGRSIDPPTGALAGVLDWSLDVPAKIAGITQETEYRGLVLRLPPDWDSEVLELSGAVAGNSELRDSLTEAFGDQVLETSFLGAGPRESSVDVEFGVIVTRAISHGDWPEITEVDRISNALGIDKAKMQELREEAEGGDISSLILLGLLDGMTEASGGSPLAFNIFEPKTFYIKEGAFDRVEYGTLFDGHPFARVLLRNEEEDTLVLLYTGFVNDLRITFVAEAPVRFDELIDDMDWVVRSTRLMSAREARTYARDDATYQMWMNDRFIEVAYAGDTTPFGEVDAADWEGFPKRTLFEGRAASRAIVTPLNQPYGIVPPEGMRIASTNRVAARWFPNDNDLWLQLKVTKLEGRAQRTMSTPVMTPAAEGGPERVFVNSTAIPLPAGYEYSQLEAGSMAVHRVLLPENPNSNLREVYYVVFDGANQVTIEAHFDKSRAEDLETLDATAQSLIKI